MKLGYYAKHLLLVQPDFQAQKYEIEESIQNLLYHMFLYYLKFHCKFNYIRYFGYSAKQYAPFWCKYSLNDLQKRVLLSLESVTNYTFLDYYN